MPGLDTSCLYSVTKNTSGVRKKFGFLPPHGKELASGEEFVVFGDIREAVIRHERTEGRRNVIALERALQRGDIEIVSTPNVILEDTNNRGVSKMLTYVGGTLGVADPCWNGSFSDPPIG
jgi:hypothetical protein